MLFNILVCVVLNNKFLMYNLHNTKTEPFLKIANYMFNEKIEITY